MNANAATRIERRPYGKTAGGEAVELFTLSRANAPDGRDHEPGRLHRLDRRARPGRALART